MQTESSRFAILDPSHYHTNAGAQPRVYTDRKGNMHDPDYHLFPVYASSSHNSQSSSEEQEQDGYYTNSFTASSPPRSPRFGPTITVSPAPTYTSAPSSYQCPTANKFSRSRRSSKSHSGRVSLDSNYSADEDVEDDSSLYSEYLSEAEEAKDKQHPAQCLEGVKKGIQSIALSVNINAFRARRRVKSALRR